MQIMPKTYAALRTRLGLGPDPFDPHDNILAGAAYLREMFDRYGAPGFLAAYNAGPGRYQDHLATGQPLPPETRIYVARLASMIHLASDSHAAIEAEAAPTNGPGFVALSAIRGAHTGLFTPLQAAAASSFASHPGADSAAKSTPELRAESNLNALSHAILAPTERSSTLFPAHQFRVAFSRSNSLFVALSPLDSAP